MVIVCDTNVLSELMRGRQADPHVVRWLRSLDERPVTTSINRAEVLSGLALLPHGRRRTGLLAGLDATLERLDATLAFTSECAAAYAEIIAIRSMAGRPIGAMDALIAAVTKVNGAAIATRDVDGFSGIGLEVHDPWTDPPR